MEVRIKNFTGYETDCEVLFFDKKGVWQKTMYLNKLQVTLCLNKKKNYRVEINAYECFYYAPNGEEVNYTLTEYELLLVETGMKECVDWEEWEQHQNKDYDEYLKTDTV